MSTQTQMNRSTAQMPETRSSPQQMQDVPSRPMREAPNAAMRPMQGDMRQNVPASGTETKPAVRSTEFYIYLAAVGGTLLASYLVGRDAAGVDTFRANQAWWLITLLTIAYLGSRGLAKAASSWRSHSNR